MKKGAKRLNLFGLLSFLIAVMPVNADIVINEFLANGIVEPDSEWVEVYNTGSVAADLAGYNISETSSKNITLEGVIPAKGFALLVENFSLFNSTFPNANASGIGIIEYGEMGLNFKLANGDGLIEFYDANGNLIDSIEYAQNSGTQENISIGRYPDGSSNIINLTARTPGDKNDNASPTLNEWINPKFNNSVVGGIVNITINVTDDADNTDKVLVNFNGGFDHEMSRNGDIFYFLWDTELNADGWYDIIISMNDFFGFSSQDVLFDATVDNTAPSIYDPGTTANARDFVELGSQIEAFAYATDANLLKVTCTLESASFESSDVIGDLHICGLTAPLIEGDFTVILTAIDKANNKNTTNTSFTTRHSTSAQLTVNDITVNGMGQSDKIVEVKATLSNTGASPIYDAGIILDSFSSTKLSPASLPYQGCSGKIDMGESCNATFNVKISGGATGSHNIFWSANWTDNKFITRQFESVTKSSFVIANNPQITAAESISTAIEHGKNAILRLHINSTGNYKLENVNVNFIEGTLKSSWLNPTNAFFSSIDAGANQSLDIDVTIPEHTNPNTYTGMIGITANGVSQKIVDIEIEVPLDSSWTSYPNNITAITKSNNAGLAGSFKINNSGNIGHYYSLTKSGNFVTYNLWDPSNPSNIYVEAGEIKAVSIHHLQMEGNTPPNIEKFELIIDITSANTSQSNKTFISLVRDDTDPEIEWMWSNTIEALSTTDPFVAENNTLSFLIGASEPNNNPINFTWFIDNAEVSHVEDFVFDLTNNFSAAGTYAFKLVVTESNSNSASQEWHVTVTNTNREPVLDDISDKSAAEDSALNFDITFFDPDNDTLTFAANVSGMAFTKDASNSLAAVSWTPNNDYVGNNIVEIIIKDSSKNDSGIFAVDVSNTNDAPEIISFFPRENKTIAEDVGNQTFNVTVIDIDGDDSITIWWRRNGTIVREIHTPFIIPPKAVTFDDQIVIDNLDKGSYNITVILNDTRGAETRYEWKLTVTTDIVSENLTSPVLSLNESQRQNVTNVTINQSAFGGIDFGDNSLNFSGIVKLEDAFNISSGFISVDTDTYPALKDKPALLTMKDLNFTKAPLIYRAEDFESTSGAVICPEDICTNITYDLSSGILTFRVSSFSTFFTLANTSNGAPVITSIPVTKANAGGTYKYDVEASDPDGDALNFSLVIGPSGMSISSSTGLIIWTPSNSQIGTHNATVNVSDSNLSATQSFEIEVSKGPRLSISDLDVAIDDETDKNLQNNSKISDEAKPGSKIKFKIKLENLFERDEDLDMDDVETEVIIQDIDDGDDLEEEADSIDIKQGREETIEVEFEIPLEVDEDTYDVIINAEGEDDNNTKHEITYTLQLEVEKEKHEIIVSNAILSPLTVQCQRSISLNIEVMNIGAEDEDEVSLEISSSELGISSLTENIELDEGTDDNIYLKIINENLDEDIAAGIYPIAIKTRYDGKESDTETVNLEVKDCEKIKEVQEPLKEKPKDREIRPVTIIQQKKNATSAEENLPRHDEGYFTLVAILMVLFVGTAIFIIGGSFIVLRK